MVIVAVSTVFGSLAYRSFGWIAIPKANSAKIGRRMGVYRAIVDIAEVIRKDPGPNLAAYSEGQLAAALHQQRRIKYYVSESKSDSTMHIGLSSRYSGRTRLDWDRRMREVDIEA